jgi:hypothetical protein
MAPRGARRRIVTSPEPNDQPSSGPPAPTSQPVNDTEHFTLDNVSGSDEPVHSDHGRNEGVNNPDAAPTKLKSTADVDYFFDKKSRDVTFCVVCK